MTRKTASTFILIMLSALSFAWPGEHVRAQTVNAGFVPANIWYSQDPFEEGDKIRIYTLIFNPDSRELSGTVIFFDNSIFLGKKDFVAPPKGVKDVFMEWTVTTGSHNIFGKIENARFLVAPGKYEEVYLAGNETSKSSRTVNKKIALNLENFDPDISSIVDNVKDAGEESLGSIGEFITDNTPDFIEKPVAYVADTIEAFRQETGQASRDRHTEIKKEIETMKTEENETSAKKTFIEELEKPAKFTELFALALFSNTFENKYVFYTLLFLITFLLLRYILKRVR